MVTTPMPAEMLHNCPSSRPGAVGASVNRHDGDFGDFGGATPAMTWFMFDPRNERAKRGAGQQGRPTAASINEKPSNRGRQNPAPAAGTPLQT